MIRSRVFRWADLDGLLAVWEASALSLAGQSFAGPEQFVRQWQSGGAWAERDLWVAEDGGGIVGYGGLRPWHSPGWLQGEVVVHPEWRGRGVGSALLQQLVQEAAGRGQRYLGATAPDHPPEVGRFLQSRGFEPFIPRLHLRLRPVVVPGYQVVRGHRVRPAGREESALLAEVTNAAYGPSERVGPADAEGYRRYLEGSGQVVGLCETYGRQVAIDGVTQTSGHIASLAILPDHRRRGLGRWLLARGIRYCQQKDWPTVELNVDRDNQPARRLYENVGFQPVYAYTVYRLPLA